MPRLRRRTVAQRGLAVLPTAFTLGNLLCGFASIFIASRLSRTDLPFHWTPLTFAAIFIFVGMLLDALDGRIARLTRSFSDLGAQLDSMADMVTFGVAPAFLAVQLVGVEAPFYSEVGDRYFDRIAVAIAGIYVACAALRLARFNIESAVSHSESAHAIFKGLPSPGAAGTVASLVLLHQHFLFRYTGTEGMPLSARLAAVGMVLVMLLVALAMVGQFRYVHIMNRYVRGRAPFGTVAKAVFIVGLMIVHLQGALAAAFVIYALSAPTMAVYRWSLRRLGRGGHAAESGSAAAAGAQRGPEATWPAQDQDANGPKPLIHKFPGRQGRG